MGNSNQEQLPNQVTSEQLLKSIDFMMNLQEGQKINYHKINKALVYFHIYYKHHLPYESEREGRKQVHSGISKVFYHFNYQKVLTQMLNLIIAEEKFVLNKISYFVNEEDWRFLFLLMSFISIFANQNIKNIAENNKMQQNRIPDVFGLYENNVSFFKSLTKNLNHIIGIQNGILGETAKRNQYICLLIQLSFTFYVQLVFQNKEIQHLVSENYEDNIKTSAYLLGLSMQRQNQSLTQCCTIYISYLILNSSQLPHVAPVRLFGFSKLPVNKAPTIYHQLLLLLTYQLSISENINSPLLYQLCIQITKKVKVIGDFKILYYLEQLCAKTNFFLINRAFLLQLIRSFIKSSQNSTKYLQKYKETANTTYKLMTDNGNKEVSANEVYKIVVEKSFGTPSSIFANAHEEFLLSNLNKSIAKNKVSEQQLWSIVLEERGDDKLEQ